MCLQDLNVPKSHSSGQNPLFYRKHGNLTELQPPSIYLPPGHFQRMLISETLSIIKTDDSGHNVTPFHSNSSRFRRRAITLILKCRSCHNYPSSLSSAPKKMKRSFSACQKQLITLNCLCSRVLSARVRTGLARSRLAGRLSVPIIAQSHAIFLINVWTVFTVPIMAG